MRPIDLNLGADVIVRGSLVDIQNRRAFPEMSLEVDLPNGNTISVEWDDENGRFEIVTFRDDWENNIDTRHEQTPSAVAHTLRLLAWASEQKTRMVDDDCPPPFSFEDDVIQWSPDCDSHRSNQSVVAATDA